MFLCFLLAASFAGVVLSPNLAQVYVNETIRFTATVYGDGSIGELTVNGPGFSYSKEIWAGPYGTNTEFEYKATKAGRSKIVARFGNSTAEAVLDVKSPVNYSTLITEIQNLRKTIKNESLLKELDSAEALYYQGKYDLAQIKLTEIRDQIQPEGQAVPVFPRIFMLAVIAAIFAVFVLYFMQ